MQSGIARVLHPALFPDPAAVLRGPSVDARLVSAGTAVAPADHASQKDLPAGVREGERPARVPLEDEQVSSATLTLAPGPVYSQPYLTGIDASREDPGAQHPLADHVAHQSPAHGAVDEPDRSLLQDRRRAA